MAQPRLILDRTYHQSRNLCHNIRETNTFLSVVPLRSFKTTRFWERVTIKSRKKAQVVMPGSCTLLRIATSCGRAFTEVVKTQENLSLQNTP